jgi:lactate permease
MWEQNYQPLPGALWVSALVAAMPIFVVLFLLGVRRSPAWVAALSGLAAALVVATLMYRMPVVTALSATAYGAAFGLFPICWILFWAILLHELTVATGLFDILKDSLGGVTRDRRLQALLVAFAFGAFLEGAAGFGAPVAVAGAMLVGLGFPRFAAAMVCLLANTAPVAFGSIGIPVITLSGVTGLPVHDLSVWVGRICAPISVIIPTYLVLVLGGKRGLAGVLPACLVCGIAFALVQFLVSNFLGPQLTDLLSSLAAIGALAGLLKWWQPRDQFVLPGDSSGSAWNQHDGWRILRAWLPYLLLVLIIFFWSLESVKRPLEHLTVQFAWPGLHNLVVRNPPVVSNASPYAALFKLNWLTASGTACLLAVGISALAFRVGLRQFGGLMAQSAGRLRYSILTIASVLALAFLMNYCGATGTLGMAFAATGRFFPFFSPLLGWLGVFLVGSDTSSNALFGNLQVVTAGKLGYDQVLMAASNSSGGVMGKMISLSSIAVAAVATGLPREDESKLFRSLLRHSLILAGAIGLVVFVYAAAGGVKR